MATFIPYGPGSVNVDHILSIDITEEGGWFEVWAEMTNSRYYNLGSFKSQDDARAFAVNPTGA